MGYILFPLGLKFSGFAEGAGLYLKSFTGSLNLKHNRRPKKSQCFSA